jgi:saccharopine dehydrogenase-like NADP-dependent oxidoreductase
MAKNCKLHKIALVGSGNIGGTLAHIIALQQLGEVVLLDRTSLVAQGKALDISQSLAVYGQTVNIVGSAEYEEIDIPVFYVATLADVQAYSELTKGTAGAVNATGVGADKTGMLDKLRIKNNSNKPTKNLSETHK